MEDKKPWERPWTTQEMVENASNWNLAGDAGLLKYLEEFSDKMLTKAKDTNERLNDLIDSAEETSLALNNATNQFMGLRNTQFIESRVYEEDETLPIKYTEKKEKPKPTEAERLEEMKQAIVNGLDIIDKYYEKVEIPESDSEDDSSEANIVYKPVDPYIDRPLPYVIGTSEWHKYWHVGLGHSSSDSEVENEEEQFSESESEQDIKALPSRDGAQIPGLSDSESEDYSKNKMSRPVANSTFNDQTTKNMFDSSDSETGSLPPQVNTVNSNFAEELAAKLGKVESSNIEVEVNTKPIKKPPPIIPGGLFSDEPPPLDDDDIFVSKNITSDLFSSGNGLFDDDNNDFWNTKPAASNKSVSEPIKQSVDNKDLFAEANEQNDIFNNKSHVTEESVKPKIQQTVKKPLGLFDDDDEIDDNNIFSTSSITQPKKTILAPVKIIAPITSEEPPELKTASIQQTGEVIKPKKPVGGVSVLGPNLLLDSKIFKKRVSSSSDSDNDFDKNLNKVANEYKNPVLNETETIKSSNEPKKIPSLFDDSSPLFSDDIFNNSDINKFSSKLFKSDKAHENTLFKSVETKDDDVKERIVIQKSEPNIEQTKSLFINEPPPLEKQEVKNSSLFHDDFADELFSNKDNETKSNKQLKSLSLFDDGSDDDLFVSITKKSAHSLFDPNPPFLDTSNTKKFKSVNLFDPNPPELEESDNKSENQHSDYSNSYGSMNAGRAFLYDTEPPMLSNESSGIARDQSTRLESEDSSFFPSMSSSRRHSDIFQDTQSADSLLTTRNKISFRADSTEKSNLSGIAENNTLTKIDITASGNESSLNNDSSVFKSNISTEVEKVPSKIPNIAEKQSNESENSSFLQENIINVKDNNTEKIIDIPKKHTDNISSETAKPITGKKPSLPNKEASRIFKSNNSSETTKPITGKKPSLPNKEDSQIFKSNISPDKEKEDKPIFAKKASLFSEDDSQIFKSNISKEDKPIVSEKPNIFNEEDSQIFNISTEQEKEEIPNISKKTNLLTTENKNLFVDSDSDDDLFSNKSSGSKNSSTSDINNSSSTKPAALKTKNIFESDLFSGPNLKGIPDVDLFKKPINQNTLTETELVDKDSKNVFNNLDNEILDVLTINKENDNKKFNYEENLKSDEDIKIDPKKSLSFEKNLELASKEEPDGEVINKGTSPGKLKHNLNINLSALLPGASPPRKQNLEKSVSLDSTESKNQSSIEDSIKPVPKSAEPKPTLEKSVSFEAPAEHKEVLPSAVKERAKIPVKRRPSSRRARQEAIRKSVADLKLEEAFFEDVESQSKSENILNITNNNLTENKPQNIKMETEEKIKNPLLNPLSPSTDEEDFLTLPTEKDLSDNFTEDSLFGKAPIISPVDILASKEFIKKKTIEKDEKSIIEDEIISKKSIKKDEKPKIEVEITKKNSVEKDEKPKTEVEDDLFDILKKFPQDFDLFGRESKTSDLFSSVSSKTGNKTVDLFANIPSSQSKQETKPANTSIFSSSDSENDLFSTSKTDLKKPPTKTLDNNNVLSSPDDDLFKPKSSKEDIKSSSKVSYEDLFKDDIFSTKKPQPKSTVIKKSLFDDDDDNDDIFGSSSSTLPKSTTSATVAATSSAIRKPIITKLKKIPVDAVEDILDPLEALKK